MLQTKRTLGNKDIHCLTLYRYTKKYRTNLFDFWKYIYAPDNVYRALRYLKTARRGQGHTNTSKQTYSDFDSGQIGVTFGKAKDIECLSTIVNNKNMAEKTKHRENKCTMIFYKILLLQEYYSYTSCHQCVLELTKIVTNHVILSNIEI